jgi:hypothetical protein
MAFFVHKEAGTLVHFYLQGLAWATAPPTSVIESHGEALIAVAVCSKCPHKTGKHGFHLLCSCYMEHAAKRLENNN